MRTRYNDIQAFTTKDQSEIRELMHPQLHSNQKQSLAEAIVKAGQITTLHQHKQTEELYYILEGTGRMTLAEQEFKVGPGDTICIQPGTPHRIKNTGNNDLRFLCCCSPAYSDADTELLE